MEPNPLRQALAILDTDRPLPAERLQEALRFVMQGTAAEADIASLLVALHRRGEGIDEVTAGAQVLREFMTRIPISRRPVTDTCGTGGTGAGLFNVSTTAAIVAAACGIRIAKHGNRRITSRSGSADVLAELGVDVDADSEVVARSIDAVGIGFCFAPTAHPAMRHVGAVRRSLAHPTIFNLLGPLCNPASAERQVLGVGRAELMAIFPEALCRLGTERFLVLHAEDGLCELSCAAPTRVAIGLDGSIDEQIWTPETFGLSTRPWSDAIVDSPTASAALIRRVLAGEAGAPRDLVLLNAAAAIWLDDPRQNPADAAERAAEAIDSGAAAVKLDELVRASRRS
ncbi:MAG TPA: anthranilate phosphoribosyltransferase [Planctomycetaceae bacterium]|nr:anthranilate phosphoribosyltransferase [Planctomycetaceae bacterium]